VHHDFLADFEAVQPAVPADRDGVVVDGNDLEADIGEQESGPRDIAAEFCAAGLDGDIG